MSAQRFTKVQQEFIENVNADPELRALLSETNAPLDLSYREERDDFFRKILTAVFNYYGNKELIGREYELKKNTFRYWFLRYGIEVRDVALLPGETIGITDKNKELRPYPHSMFLNKGYDGLPRALREKDKSYLVPKFGEEIDLPHRLILILNQDGGLEETAKELGVPKPTLGYWLKLLGIERAYIKRSEITRYMGGLREKTKNAQM